MRKNEDIEALKEELMLLLSHRSVKALRVIDKLRRIAVQRKDVSLLGYVYYRYAYFYYFTVSDQDEFRKYLQLAVHHLLRSGDMEFLGGTYNLIAYDAQDLGCYDVAYAYFMIAARTCAQVEGIALPGLLEANGGRLLTELGDYQAGRRHLRKALKMIRPFKSMHVYHYNMLVTYADEALVSFLMRDGDGIIRALKGVDAHYEASDEGEKALGRTYYLLPHVYHDLFICEEGRGDHYFRELLTSWKKVEADELPGLIFEIESLCTYMLEHDRIDQIRQLLRVTDGLRESSNLSIADRYYTLKIAHYEKTGNTKELGRALREQHLILKNLKAETMRTRRYAIEFSDMISAIAAEVESAAEENLLLQRQANTDALTGLPNRNAINKRLAALFDEAREGRKRFGIGIIDVDQFKQYNDSFGHQAGDECLRAIGEVLLSFAEDARLFCSRYGGDEFVIGYLGLSDDEIGRIAGEMAEQVTKRASREDWSVQISQGIYNCVPGRTQRLWDLLSLADQRLYRIKGENIR